MPGHRSYCFTINNDTYEDLYSIICANFKYCCFGFEVGEKNGTKHIQGYVQYYNAKTKKTVSKDFPRAHLLVAKGNFQHNIDYCSKDGDFYEIGIKPTEGGRCTYEQIEEAYADPKNNISIIRQYGRAYKEVKQLEIERKKVDTKYFVIDPEDDLITELQEYFGEVPFTIISSIQEIAAYENEDIHTLVLLYSYQEAIVPFYPRGVPIKYKVGYEYHTCKPINFVLVTPSLYHDRLTSYKKI